MREAYYEQKLCKAVRALGHDVLCLKFESPGYTGVPDRLVLLPGGKVLFVELKRPGQHERVRQKYVHEVLRGLGFEVFSSVSSLEQIEEVVQRCREVMQL